MSAMGKFGGVVGQLTTSFRFGPEVAAEARMVLSLKSDGGMDLKGWEGKQSDVYDILPAELDNEVRCHLYRTNAALIQDGVDYILRGKKVALEMDTKDYIAMLKSVVALRFGDMKNVKHEEVVPYPSWKHLKEELEHIGGDIARIARLVSEGQHMNVLRALENYKKPDYPDLILTTAHKAKGREFEIVVLADDFPEVHDKAGEFIGLEDTEANLLYVGLTRAMRVLVRNKTLRDIRKAMGIVSEPKPMVVSTVVEISEQDIDAANDALAMAREDYMTSLDDFYPDSMLQQAWARRVSE
ncbi:ATP-dependent DNA helicase Rep [compost metagenome]